MIDTDKMRADHGTYHHVPDSETPHCNLPVEECRRCAVDALCDEVERLRSLITNNALPHLIEASNNYGGCDHDVGICQCDLDGTITALDHAISNVPEAPSDE